MVHGAVDHGREHSFFRHYLEMVVVMFVSMALLGVIVSLIFALAGHSNLYHYAGFRSAQHRQWYVVNPCCVQPDWLSLPPGA